MLVITTGISAMLWGFWYNLKIGPISTKVFEMEKDFFKKKNQFDAF